MYNRIQKEAFINYQVNTSESENSERYTQVLKSFFNRLGVYEAEKEKDSCMMTYDEGYELLTKFLRRSRQYQASDRSLLVMYLNWCIMNGLSLSKDNWLSGLNLNDIDTSAYYRTSMVFDEEDLIQCLNDSFLPQDYNSIDNMYRCFLHLLYSGLDRNEVINLKKSDVDFDNQIAHTEGRDIFISKYTLNLIEYASNMEEIVRYGRGACSINIYRIKDFVIENTIPEEDKQDLKYRNKLKINFSDAISKKLSNNVRKINQSSIILSGIFNRMYNIEQETGEIDCREYLYYKRNNLDTMQKPAVVAGYCVSEYASWKKAFNLF